MSPFAVLPIFGGTKTSKKATHQISLVCSCWPLKQEITPRFPSKTEKRASGSAWLMGFFLHWFWRSGSGRKAVGTKRSRNLKFGRDLGILVLERGGKIKIEGDR